MTIVVKSNCTLDSYLKPVVIGVVTRCDSVQVTSRLVLACIRRLVVWPCCSGHERQSG
jgi:hypothetical protein